MIKIINDFFEEKDLKEVQNFALTKASYTPCWFPDDDGKMQKNKEHHYGDRFFLTENKKLFDLFKKQAELKFKIKLNHVLNISGIDLRNLDHFKPHIDWQANINILIMISGPTAVTNGTVFYTDDQLDIHVGFRENRAVLFPSTWFHSQHASTIPNLRRYTATVFVKDYYDV